VGIIDATELLRAQHAIHHDRAVAAVTVDERMNLGHYNMAIIARANG